MTPEQFRRLQVLFDQAAGLDSQRREQFLEDQGSDEETSRELRLMLAAVDECDAYEETQSKATRQFGPYQTDGLLGRGGNGAVYRAQRSDGQFEQIVAIKVLLPQFADADFQARFRAERQLLAQLNHPNITRLLDGGVTADGEAYLVMEYVDGLPLDLHCDRRNLGVRDRLLLFRQVCLAVSYAHRNLIVHRDLKPSNILVDRYGQVKLLDFGTARLLSNPESFTLPGTALLTPRYASPEQLRTLPVTTLSDVYSLGIVLHELLTGAWPFGSRDTGMADFNRVTGNTPAEPLGQTLAPGASAARSMAEAELKRLLSGDLRLIAAKSLRDDPPDRYASVDAFSEDIQAYLSNNPIQARPASLGYWAKKFIGRNRWGVAAATALLLAVAVGTVSTYWQKRTAERRFQQVREVARYQLFDLHDQLSAIAGTTKIRQELVKRTTTYLDSLAHESERDATLREELAEGYLRLGDVSGNPFVSNLGLTEDAKTAYEKGLALAADSRGNEGRKTYALLQLNLGLLEGFRGKTAESTQRIEAGIAAIREVIRRDPGEALSYFHLGNALAAEGQQAQQEGGVVGGLDRSSGYYRQATDAYEEARRRDPNNLLIHRAIAQMYDRRALSFTSTNPAQAVKLEEQAITALDSLPANERNNALVQKALSNIYQNIGWAYGQLDRFDDAQKAMDRGLAIQQRFADADPEDRRALYDLTACYRGKGIVYGYAKRNREAVEQFRKAAALHDIILKSGPNPNVAFLRADLARRISDLLYDLGDREQAKASGKDAIDRLRALCVVQHPAAVHLRETAGFLLMAHDQQLRDPREALSLMKQAIALSPDNPLILEVYGMALMANHQLDGAERVIQTLLVEARKTVGGARTRQVQTLELQLREIAVQRKQPVKR